MDKKIHRLLCWNYYPLDSIFNTLIKDYVITNNIVFDDKYDLNNPIDEEDFMFRYGNINSIVHKAFIITLIEMDDKEVAAILKYFPSERIFFKDILTCETLDKLYFMANNISFTKEETNAIRTSVIEKTLSNTKQAEIELEEDNKNLFIEGLDEID